MTVIDTHIPTYNDHYSLQTITVYRHTDIKFITVTGEKILYKDHP